MSLFRFSLLCQTQFSLNSFDVSLFHPSLLSFILIHLVSPFLCLSFLPGHHVSLQSFPPCKIQVKLPKLRSSCLPLILPSHSCWLAAAPLHLCPCPHPHPLAAMLRKWSGPRRKRNILNNSWAERISEKDGEEDWRQRYRKGRRNCLLMNGQKKTVAKTRESNCQDNETEKITRISEVNCRQAGRLTEEGRGRQLEEHKRIGQVEGHRKMDVAEIKNNNFNTYKSSFST